MATVSSLRLSIRCTSLIFDVFGLAEEIDRSWVQATPTLLQLQHEATEFTAFVRDLRSLSARADVQC
ncbi:hypothetical protein [Candidatus Amarobacter glycogenicus]|uniref:hypothetical protein n=1 Tax=Candidatus Amarobacter glycogenicus TaxID=3140699 RepID=UPI0031352F67|nr:hypothetical protein [Dehalococcoidia bacterium]